MAWAQLPLLQTKMIGGKSVMFHRKRIFCHGWFAIAIVAYPTVRADEATIPPTFFEARLITLPAKLT